MWKWTRPPTALEVLERELERLYKCERQFAGHTEEWIRERFAFLHTELAKHLSKETTSGND